MAAEIKGKNAKRKKKIKYTCGPKFAIWVSSAYFMEVSIRWSRSVPAVSY